MQFGAVRGAEPAEPPPQPEDVCPPPFDADEADPRETCTKKHPACGSAKVRILMPASEDDNLSKWSNFRVFYDRECKECRQRWTPACLCKTSVPRASSSGRSSG